MTFSKEWHHRGLSTKVDGHHHLKCILKYLINAFWVEKMKLVDVRPFTGADKKRPLGSPAQ